MIWNNSIFLIDAKYLCYRSVYALFNEPISSVENSMMYGFMSTLLSLAKGLKVTQSKKIKPSNIILCWDSKHSLRQIAYPNYKKRKELDDYQEQVIKKVQEAYPRLRYWMKRMGFTSALCSGYEADDLFAGYTRQYDNKKYVIVTNDEDIYQLLRDHVAIWMLRKKPFLFTEEGFVEKYKIEPEQWAAVKAVGGCKSDNIPGLQGIGEKRAIQYITGNASDKVLNGIDARYGEWSSFLDLTELPYNNTKFDLSLDKTNINWDEFTKWCQIYNHKRFIMQYNEFKDAFNFE